MIDEIKKVTLNRRIEDTCYELEMILKELLERGGEDD